MSRKYSKMIEIDDPNLAKDIFWATKIYRGDDLKDLTSYAIVKDNTIGTTDIHRIHMVLGLPEKAIPDGNYIVLAGSTPDRIYLAIPEKEEPEKIPNFSKIFDEMAKAKKSYELLVSNNGTVMALEYARLIRNFPEPTPIAYDFIADLGASEKKYNVSWISQDKPVFFALENKRAAIMPIRFE